MKKRPSKGGIRAARSQTNCTHLENTPLIASAAIQAGMLPKSFVNLMNRAFDL
jgi:hypothetical protein